MWPFIFSSFTNFQLKQGNQNSVQIGLVPIQSLIRIESSSYFNKVLTPAIAKTIEIQLF